MQVDIKKLVDEIHGLKWGGGYPGWQPHDEGVEDVIEFLEDKFQDICKQ